MKVKIKEVKLSINYTMDMDYLCPICSESMLYACYMCKDEPEYNQCRGVKGTCGKYYHYHCIEKCISNKIEQLCPVTKQPWIYEHE
jgi:hypothetical protein